MPVAVVAVCGGGGGGQAIVDHSCFLLSKWFGSGTYLPIKTLPYFLHQKSNCLKFTTASLDATIYLEVVFRGHMLFPPPPQLHY